MYICFMFHLPVLALVLIFALLVLTTRLHTYLPVDKIDKQ